MRIDTPFIEETYFSKILDNYLNQLFGATKNLKGILLFGSVARGDAEISENKTSDIDLLVIFQNNSLPRNHMERSQFQNDSIGLESFGVDAIWLRESEFKEAVKIKTDIILSALYEGKILYDPENLISEQRENLFKELKEKGVVKKENYWIWPLKYLGEEIEW